MGPAGGPVHGAFCRVDPQPFYPSTHGVRRLAGSYLPHGFETPPELLKTAGYTTVGFGSLACNDSLTGQCGFTVGFDAPELNLNIGTTAGGSPYEFVWTFNVTVPEPTTATLLGLGLVGLAAVRRRRA